MQTLPNDATNRPRGRGCLLRVAEVAERLDVAPSTVYRAINRGDLPAVQLGHRTTSIRLDEVELEEAIYGSKGAE